MRVAYFTDTYAPEINGVANTLKKLHGYLDEKEIEYIVFAPAYGSCTEDDKGVIYRFDGLKLAISPESCIAFPSTEEIFEKCDDFQPDLIHVTTELGIGYKGMKYAASRDLPLVKSYHTNFEQYLKYYKLDPARTVIQAYLKWFHRTSHLTLVPSRDTLERLRAQKYQNLDIWSRGIDTKKFNPLHRNQRTRDALGINERIAFLYVGRLAPEKGLNLLAEAIRNVNEQYKNKIVFIFTGDGPYSQVLKDESIDNVIFKGFKTGHELSEIYASADCFVFPSGTETFGNSALEAIASGLPVVGINSGGVTDFLIHGHNSLLSELGDKRAYASNLIKLIENEQLRRNLSANAISTAKSRTWEMIFDGLIEKYEIVIEKVNTNRVSVR